MICSYRLDQVEKATKTVGIVEVATGGMKGGTLIRGHVGSGIDEWLWARESPCSWRVFMKAIEILRVFEILRGVLRWK